MSGFGVVFLLAFAAVFVLATGIVASTVVLLVVALGRGAPHGSRSRSAASDWAMQRAGNGAWAGAQPAFVPPPEAPPAHHHHHG